MHLSQETQPLDPQTLESYLQLRQQAGVLESQLENRITYILKKIYETFGSQLDYWYTSDAPEGDQGDLLRCWRYNNDTISDLCIHPYLEAVIILNNGSEWGLHDDIPSRWLFEDFEEELVNGKRLYEERQAQKKEDARQKRQAKKAEKERLKATAAAKLSPAERKALGL